MIKVIIIADYYWWLLSTDAKKLNKKFNVIKPARMKDWNQVIWSKKERRRNEEEKLMTKCRQPLWNEEQFFFCVSYTFFFLFSLTFCETSTWRGIVLISSIPKLSMTRMYRIWINHFLRSFLLNQKPFARSQLLATDKVDDRSVNVFLFVFFSFFVFLVEGTEVLI